MKRQLKGDKKPFNCLFLFVQKSSFCILYEKILQFVRKATLEIITEVCVYQKQANGYIEICHFIILQV